jgi:hypothetical protein
MIVLEVRCAMRQNSSNINAPVLLDVPEVARLLCLSERSIRTLIRRKVLIPVRIGRRTLIRPCDVQALAGCPADVGEDLQEDADDE